MSVYLLSPVHYGLEVLDARNEFSMERMNRVKKNDSVLNAIISFQVLENSEGITIEELYKKLNGLIYFSIAEIKKYNAQLRKDVIIFQPSSVKKRYKFVGKLPSGRQIKREFPKLYFSLFTIQADI